jgi:hypothetical protein
MESTNLRTLMDVDIVRDKVMDQVAPIDVVNFVIGTGIKFSKEDMERYKSIFKYIIPNRRWLRCKLEEGYSFTVVGTDLDMLSDPIKNGLGTREWINLRSCPRISTRHMWMLMIVVKDGHTIPCSNEFLINSGVMHTNRNRSWPEVYTMNRNTTIPPMLAMRTGTHEVPIIVSCTSNVVEVGNYLLVDPFSSVYGYMRGNEHLKEVQHLTAKLNQKEVIATSKVAWALLREDIVRNNHSITIAFDEAYPQLGVSDTAVIPV